MNPDCIFIHIQSVLCILSRIFVFIRFPADIVLKSFVFPCIAGVSHPVFIRSAPVFISGLHALHQRFILSPTTPINSLYNGRLTFPGAV